MGPKTTRIYSAPTTYQRNSYSILKASHQLREMNVQLRLR